MSAIDKSELIERLTSVDPGVRMEGVRGAFASGNGALAAVLLAHVARETELSVRLAIVPTLGKLLGNGCVEPLRELMKDPVAEMRIRILETVAHASREEGHLLAVRALSDTDRDVRDAAFKQLRMLGKRGILDLLAKLLKNPDRTWALHATLAMGQINSDDTVPLLASALANPDLEISMQARTSLKRLARYGNVPAQQVLDRATAAGPLAGAPGAPGKPAGATAGASALAPAAQPASAHAASAVSSPSQPAASSPAMVADELAMTIPRASMVPPPSPSLATHSPAASSPPPASAVRTMSSAVSALASTPSAHLSARPPSPAPSSPPALARGSSLEDDFSVATPSNPEKTGDMSPAVYKALFGESMPRIQRPTIDENEPPVVGAPPSVVPAATEEPVEVEQITQSSGTAPKPKWQMSNCRSCGFVRRERPDRQKMAPMRLWCNLLKKETSQTKTCPRGKWSE